MDFAPFQSDEDEEEANFIEKSKKKKDGTDKRKKKSKIDRKDRSSFTEINSPIGVKTKQVVHGVVGPADYIFDQGGLPLKEEIQQKPVTQNSEIPVSSATPIVNQQPQSQQSNYSPAPFKTQSQVTNDTSGVFQSNFSSPAPVVTMSSKIERPHSAAAMSLEKVPSNTPTPFKQVQYQKSPNKVTLLEQAKINSTPNQQLQKSSVLKHQRNQSYSQAMSAQIISKEEIDKGGKSIKENQSLKMQSTTIESHSPIREDTGERIASQSIPTKMTDENWAYFSVSPSHCDNDNTNEIPSEATAASSGKFHGSFSDSLQDITGSIEGESEDSVWRMTDEQREYYTNQFKNLQPNINDIIKGAQARDFFLKSNLRTEVLSKIWRLSDLDNDHALNLEEFCIAMHLVVAVRHGYELPQELPETLLPGDETTAEINSETDGVFGGATSEGENDIKGRVQVKHSNKDVMQSRGQTNHVIGPISEQHTLPVSNHKEQINEVPKDMIRSTEYLNKASDWPKNSPSSPKTRHTSSSNDAAIARPRAQATKNNNLMDASPWQLLPPPSSKPKLKTIQSLDHYVTNKKDNKETELPNDDNNTLVMIDKQNDLDSCDISDVKNENIDTDTLMIRKMTSQKNILNLSKEKSRSIDSLRSDVSESSEFHWKRNSKIEPRPRSLTDDSTNDNPPMEKEYEIPPTPPPRPKGHTRASSLDWNQLFNSSKNFNSSPELNMSLKGSIKNIAQKDPFLNEQKTVSDEQGKNSTKESLVRFSDELQYLNQSISSMEVKMRKNELQEQISNLRIKNMTLYELNRELELQLKEVRKDVIQAKSEVESVTHL